MVDCDSIDALDYLTLMELCERRRKFDEAKKVLAGDELTQKPNSIKLLECWKC